MSFHWFLGWQLSAMIRLLRKRPLFALAALAGFVLSGVTEARALDPCPHHDALPGELAPDSQGSGHGDHSATTDHSAHTAGSSPASAALSNDSSQPSEDGAASHEGCSCIGHCDAGTSSLRTDTKSDWDFEAAATVFHFDKDKQRTPTSASSTGATFGPAGRIAVLDDTGWSTLDLKGAWHRGGAIATP